MTDVTRRRLAALERMKAQIPGIGLPDPRRALDMYDAGLITVEECSALISYKLATDKAFESSEKAFEWRNRAFALGLAVVELLVLLLWRSV